MNVVVGMNTNGSCSSRTLISLARMFNADPDFQARLILVEGGCADFAGGRNRLVREFLSTGTDWLLVVDSDMVFTPEDWETLRDSADTTERPFVTGTYFVDNDPPRPCCVVFDEDYNAHSPTLTDDMSPLLRVHASGIGFDLIHRDVFLKAGDMNTHILSRLYYPDREGHSLEWWGNNLRFKKGDHKDFTQFSQEMLDYCIRDVDITRRLYYTLMEESKDWDWSEAIKLEYNIWDIQMETGTKGSSIP